MADKEAHRVRTVELGVHDGLVQLKNMHFGAFTRVLKEIQRTGDSTDCGAHLRVLDELAEFPHRKVTGELRKRRTDAVGGLVAVVGNDEKAIISLYNAWRLNAQKRDQPPK